MGEPIAIIGMACRFPGGADSPESFWKLLVEGRDTVTEISPERFDVDAVYHPTPRTPGRMNTRQAAFLSDVAHFDAPFFKISQREAIHVDPQQRLLLEVSWEALEDAGIPVGQPGLERTGVYVGLVTHDYEFLMYSDQPTLDLYALKGGAPYGASGRVSFNLGFQGPSLSVATACSSSLTTVHLACQALRSGECDLALASGAQVTLQPGHSICMSQSYVMSSDGRCKFGDASADGYGRGEGVGVVVLKRLSSALAAGDPIRAVILGSVLSNDGALSQTLGKPSPVALQSMMHQACQSAGVEPASIQYVEANGTGTPSADQTEIPALGAVYGPGRPAADRILVGSVKTNIGHTEGAAGVAGLIKLALSLEQGYVPPSLHLRTPSPHIPWERLHLDIPQQGQPWPEASTPRRGAINSFGISNSGVHAILEQAPARPEPSAPPASEQKGAWLLPLSARAPEALTALVQAWVALLEAPRGSALADLCYTASRRRVHHPLRLTVAAGSREELVRSLRAHLQDEPAPGLTRQDSPTPPRAPVFVFAGRGLRSAEGLGALADEAAFRAGLERCDAVFSRGGVPPPSVELFTPRSRVGEELSAAAHFTLLVCLAAQYRAWGITPSALVGAGIGELAAAHAAGLIELEAASRRVLDAGERGKRGTPRPGLPPQAPLRGGAGFDVEVWLQRDLDAVPTHALDTLILEGAELFLELGSGALLADRVARGLAARGRQGRVLPGLDVDRPARTGLRATLGTLHCLGLEVNWEALHPQGQVVALPRYPWQRERYWMTPPGPRSARRPPRHPLLGEALELSFQPGTRVWTLDLDAAALPWLGEHRVHGTPVLPLAALVEMALVATEGPVCLLDSVLLRPLILPESGSTRAQFVLREPEGRFQLLAATEDGGWSLCAEGRFERGTPAPQAPGFDPRRLREAPAQELPTEAFYKTLREAGLDYGSAFRGIHQLWSRDGEVLAQLEAPLQSLPHAPYRQPPALLDAGLHSALATLPSPLREILGPTRLERFVLHQPGPAAWAWARPRSGESAEPNVDVFLFDAQGVLLVEAWGVGLRSLGRAPSAASRQDGSALRAALSAAPAAERLQRLALSLRDQLGALLQLPPASLDLTSSLVEQRCDSLAAIRLKSWAESMFQVSVPISALLGDTHLMNLAGLIAQQLETLSPPPPPAPISATGDGYEEIEL